IVPYELAIGISILSPIIFYFYRTWLKSRYDKKLETIKSELAKENKKHEIRLNNYKEYYKKIDETQKKMNELAQLFSERISEKATDIANNGTFSEVMNSTHYIEIYSKLFEEINSLTLQLIVQTNEFKFYASDNLLELIEKLESGNWRKLKILDCPCDAPCQASIDKFELHPGGKIELSWNQMESWCGPKVDEHIRKSIYKRVEKGQYRVRINYKTEGENDETIYKNFTL
ncbi:MAG: hypothetical protein CVU00_03580, partial [Bacteroidetes bacterium HGW-Bacteroidetes-17]